MPPPDPTADLEANLVDVARSLFTPGTVPGVLQHVVDLAVATIDGCDAAGIFYLHEGDVVTVASTAPIVIELDQLQIASDEGPCVDALRSERSSHAFDLADDDRWPTFGPAAARAGIRSTLAFRLSDQPASAINLYAHLPAAFGATDRAKGLIFATLAGLAVEIAEERADEEQRFTNLHEALVTRELIGQAQGILMERERISGEQAFDVLRRASQHLNIKVREVARTLVETGENPMTGKPGPPDHE
jgi:hypothetical protein